MEPITQPNHFATDVTAADELRRIAADIQDYMGKWVLRSRRVIGQANESAHSEFGLSTQLQKFEENQHKWETKRQREMDEIAEKGEELAAAWQKLESEQRQFLQMKDSLQYRTNQLHTVLPANTTEANVALHAAEVRTPSTPSVQHSSPATASVQTPPCTPQVAPRLPANIAYAAASPAGGHARDAAIRQFEQLRREVASRHRS